MSPAGCPLLSDNADQKIHLEAKVTIIVAREKT